MSIFLLAAISIAVFYYLRQEDYVVGREYDNLVQLRRMLQLCIKHRSVSHAALTKGVTEVHKHELQHVIAQLNSLSESLIAKIPSDHKPIHRTFQTKLKAMHVDWQHREASRNQVIHGQVIRQCMYLIDEATQVLLSKTDQGELSEHYHRRWQKVFDSMEALTELRLCVLDAKSHNGMLRVKQSCIKTKRKIEQLVAISPSRLATPSTVAAIEKLSQISSTENVNLSDETLYDLTSGLSSAIILGYDQILYDVTNEMCRPLPRMWLV